MTDSNLLPILIHCRFKFIDNSNSLSILICHWFKFIFNSNLLQIQFHWQFQFIANLTVCNVYVPLWKRHRCFWLLSFLTVSIISMRCDWLFNPECRTTVVKVTYLTPTAVPFKIWKNNSLKVFTIGSVYETICWVSVPVYL